jgi:hypothetical protein
MSLHLCPTDRPLLQREAIERIVGAFEEVLLSRSAGRARAAAVRDRLQAMGAPPAALAEYSPERVDTCVVVQCCDGTDSEAALEFVLYDPVGSVLLGFESRDHQERCGRAVAKLAQILSYHVVPD